MNKLWKWIGICAGAGVVLMIVGVLLGANLRGISFEGGRFRMASGDAETIAAYTNTEAITELNIRTASLRVDVVVGESYGFEIKYGGRSRNISYELSNGVLTIRQRSRFSFNFGVGWTGNRGESVTVFIPAGVELDSATIRVSSGNIRIEGLEANNMSLRTSSGRINADAITADNLDVRASSGSVTLQGIEARNIEVNISSGSLTVSDAVYNEFRARTNSGSVRMDGVFLGYTNVRVDSGSITLNVDGAERDFNYTTRASSGTVRVNDNRVGTITMDRGADNSITVRSSSGNIRLNFEG